MRRTLLALAVGAALLAPAQAQASHPCWTFNELTCQLTSCHHPKDCL